MSIAICPKCKSPNDDTRYDGAWLVCAICNNRWFPSAATVDSIPTAEIPQVRKVTSKPLPTPAKPELVTRSVSGEYLPDEPDTDGDNDVIDTLNDLLECCRDGEYGFRECAAHTKSKDIQTLLVRRAEDCSAAAMELQVLIRKMGGEAEEGGTVIAPAL